MEISCALRLTLVKKPLYGKNPTKYIHLLRFFSIRKYLLGQETKVDPTYYKNPKPSINKVRIIHPNFGTLELWKSSLTQPSEGFWLVPHRYSPKVLLFCVVHVLSWACENYVTNWRFLSSSIANRTTFILCQLGKARCIHLLKTFLTNNISINILKSNESHSNIEQHNIKQVSK